ncbi:MAG: Ig-like domain-containing protein [Canibacter sp.]
MKTTIGALLTIALVLMPVAAFAAEPAATTTRVNPAKVADHTTYVLGEPSIVSARVTSDTAAPTGDVEFFDGDQSLGSAELTPSNETTSVAELETDQWPSSGAREVTAVYTPEGDFAPSTSSATTYRIVDTSRIIDDIDLVGECTAPVTDVSLDWTIANIWFSNFNVGFEREVIDGNITLPDLTPGSTIPELQDYYFRPFTFHDGTGTKDADGNRILEFAGTARLTSGSGNQWNFTDPHIHISAAGDGYITAEFSGFYTVSGQQNYGPTRVTIATFNGAELTADDAGNVDTTIELNWEGQANGPGTWAHDYNNSFPNEFIALLNPGVNLFFAESSVATDASKIPHPINLSFTDTEAACGSEPEEPAEEEPAEETPAEETPAEETPSSQPDNTAEPVAKPATQATANQEPLAATGQEQPWILALALIVLAGLTRIRRSTTE